MTPCTYWDNLTQFEVKYFFKSCILKKISDKLYNFYILINIFYMICCYFCIVIICFRICIAISLEFCFLLPKFDYFTIHNIKIYICYLNIGLTWFYLATSGVIIRLGLDQSWLAQPISFAPLVQPIVPCMVRTHGLSSCKTKAVLLVQSYPRNKPKPPRLCGSNHWN